MTRAIVWNGESAYLLVILIEDMLCTVPSTDQLVQATTNVSF